MFNDPDPRSTAAHLHKCEGCKACAQHWKARALVAEAERREARDEVCRLIGTLRLIFDTSSDDLARVKQYAHTMVQRSPGQTWRFGS